MRNEEEDRKTSLASKILSLLLAIVIAVIVLTFLVKQITRLWPALLIIALVTIAIVVAFRLYKHYKERNKW